eukprot:scaffold8248_cov118-Isochrysis_galbana.AAC.3
MAMGSVFVSACGSVVLLLRCAAPDGRWEWNSLHCHHFCCDMLAGAVTLMCVLPLTGLKKATGYILFKMPKGRAGH